MDAGTDAERKRLRWRCRRGMRELDVLLERYVAEVWPVAGEAERRSFAALLEWPDPELAALLFGRSSTSDGGIAAVVAECARLRGCDGERNRTDVGPAAEPRLLES
jgi:antitoxin CptB